MITDQETNYLFLADILVTKHSEFYNRLCSVLNKHKIPYSLLPETKDIWAVDYMPIQVNEKKFVQFVYNPDYLQYKKWLPTISNNDIICEKIKINTVKTAIVLDGGNIVKAKNKAILCEKVFKENKNYSKKEILHLFHDLLEVDTIIIVPQQPKDIIGHADGMVRFLDDNTVLVNDYKYESKQFLQAFYSALKKGKLDIIEIPYNPYQNNNYNQANGEYINYLLMQQILLLPIFNLETDNIALKQFEKLFPYETIVTIECNEIANLGGVLNCISWNVQKNKKPVPQ
jgi:agmatine deiminase